MVARYYYITALFLILPLNCHEENTAIEFDIRDERHTVEKHVTIVLFVIFLLYSVVSNILMMVVFCWRQDNLISRPFMLIVFQLIICSFLSFTPQVTIVLLELLKEKNNSDQYNKTWIYKIFVTMETFSFIATLHFAFLLTVNRFVVLNLPKFNAFFESLKFYILIALVWLSAFVPSFAEFYYCTKIFIASNLQWTLNCTIKTSESGETFLKIRYMWTLALPIAMFAIYILIFYNMRRKRQNTSNQCGINDLRMHAGYQAKDMIRIGKYERSMLIQAAMVCGAIEIQTFCFYFLPQIAANIGGEKAKIPVNIFINCYIIFNDAVLPTANLIFVKRFRDYIRQTFLKLLFKITSTKGIDTVVSITPTVLTKAQPIFRAR